MLRRWSNLVGQAVCAGVLAVGPILSPAGGLRCGHSVLQLEVKTHCQYGFGTRAIALR
jgi:hypothetical protein